MADKAKKKPPGYVFGRPTAYKAEYCKMLMDHMAEGYSFESFGGVVLACKQTMYTWCEKHRDFLDAKSKGTVLARLWWERIGRSGMMGERLIKNKDGEIERVPFKMNTTIWVFSMKNRFNYHDNLQWPIPPPASDPADKELDGLTDEELIEAAKSSS